MRDANAARFEMRAGDFFMVSKKYDPNQPRDEEGQWTATARTFTSDEGYEWHEQGPVAEWAKQIPYPLTRAVSDYVGFGYKRINDHLRGKLEPQMKPTVLRPATPEEVAKAQDFSVTDEGLKQFGLTRDQYIEKFGWEAIAHSDKPGTPDNPLRRLLDAQGNYVGHVTHIPYTTMDDPAHWVVSRLAPDYGPLQESQAKADEINTLIREQGYALPEAIQVERGAYLPGVTMADLQRMADDGAVWEEKGFTSTAVGDAGGRMTHYPGLAKDESLYSRFHDQMFDHANEVGAAIRFHIALPKGTRVVSAEALRRLDYEFPKKPITSMPRPDDIQEQYWVESDYSQTPTVKDRRLHEKDARVESEVLLGSGAQFRVVRVRQGQPYVRGNAPTYPIIEVHLEYIGGGTSEGRS